MEANKDIIATKFAKPDRTPIDVLFEQEKLFMGNEFQKFFIDAMPIAVLILNEFREIVFANNYSIELLEVENREDVIGKRPGEVFHCAHADKMESGCGTSEYCRTCGAVKANIRSQNKKVESVMDCFIDRKDKINGLNLRVSTKPFLFNKQNFILFIVTNIENEVKRKSLEQIFLHDVLNTIGCLSGYIKLLPAIKPDEYNEFHEKIEFLTNRVIEEIRSYKDLSKAEAGELDVFFDKYSLGEFIEEVIESIKKHDIAQSKEICIFGKSENIIISTDGILLRRILTNLIKNALEAISENEKVIVGYKTEDNLIEIWVHNPSYMSKRVQLQIFNKSFSTKDSNRGLGTYSIKLLTENYLNGKVFFHSTLEEGTTFTLLLPTNRK